MTQRIRSAIAVTIYVGNHRDKTTGFALTEKGEKMAEIKVPIQVNLPDDWVEQIVERLKNDPESEWVQVVRCKDCKYYNAGFECLIEGYGIERDKDWYCADAEPKGEQE